VIVSRATASQIVSGSLIAILSLILWVPGHADAQRPEPKTELVDGDLLYHVLPPDAIPAIHDPVFVSAEEAADWMFDEEIVIGVVGPDGEARAYSTWHLDHHEFVNDRVGDVPIAATW